MAGIEKPGLAMGGAPCTRGTVRLVPFQPQGEVRRPWLYAPHLGIWGCQVGICKTRGPSPPPGDFSIRAPAPKVSLGI